MVLTFARQFSIEQMSSEKWLAACGLHKGGETKTEKMLRCLTDACSLVGAPCEQLLFAAPFVYVTGICTKVDTCSTRPRTRMITQANKRTSSFDSKSSDDSRFHGRQRHAYQGLSSEDRKMTSLTLSSTTFSFRTCILDLKLTFDTCLHDVMDIHDDNTSRGDWSPSDVSVCHASNRTAVGPRYHIAKERREPHKQAESCPPTDSTRLGIFLESTGAARITSENREANRGCDSCHCTSGAQPEPVDGHSAAGVWDCSLQRMLNALQ